MGGAYPNNVQVWAGLILIQSIKLVAQVECECRDHGFSRYKCGKDHMTNGSVAAV